MESRTTLKQLGVPGGCIEDKGGKTRSTRKRKIRNIDELKAESASKKTDMQFYELFVRRQGEMMTPGREGVMQKGREIVENEDLAQSTVPCD
jgi:hypothetical protein